MSKKILIAEKSVPSFYVTDNMLIYFIFFVFICIFYFKRTIYFLVTISGTFDILVRYILDLFEL